MVNKVFLVGRLGKDPEVRAISSGTQVAEFSLATSRRYKDKSGQRQEETEWHTVTAWGRLAEIADLYLRRGTLVFVEGRIQTDSWADRKSGEKRYRTKIVCDTFQMLGGGGSPQREHAASSGGRPATTHSGNDGGFGDDDGGVPGDDSIPF